MTPEEQTKLLIEIEAVLRNVSRFFRARAAMYAALYLSRYDPGKLPLVAQEVEDLLRRFKGPTRRTVGTKDEEVVVLP